MLKKLIQPNLRDLLRNDDMQIQLRTITVQHGRWDDSYTRAEGFGPPGRANVIWLL